MEKQKAYLKYHLVFWFMLVLLLPLFNSGTKIWKFERKDENRAFRDTLTIDINSLDAFPKDCNAFYNDNFSFRTPLLDHYHHLKFNCLKISPYPEKTIIGSNEWYFSAREPNDIYKGKKNISAKDLERLLKEWKRRKQYLDDLNIKAYWVLAPIKHHVYPEFLPLHFGLNNQKRRVEQIQDYFQRDLPNLIIDPLPSLLEGKKDYQLYYKQDNHWLYSAGYITANLLLSKIRADFPEIDFRAIPKYEWEEFVEKKGIHRRTLGVKGMSEIVLHPIVTNENATVAEAYGFPVTKGFPYPKEFEMRYVNTKDRSGLKVLFIRDSFAKHIMPYVKEPFQESLFIFDAWEFKLNENIIETMKPDIVVFLGVEGMLDNILKQDW